MKTKTFFASSGLGAMVAVTSLLSAQPSAAQSAACVNLLVGAGYAGWMGVKLGDHTYWSSSFPIGQSRCVKLPVPGMVTGAPYQVVMDAILGKTVTCTPAPSTYSSSDTNTVVYNAWGTTWSPKCEMPSPAAAKQSPVSPSKAGAAALAKWETQGPLPPPK